MLQTYLLAAGLKNREDYDLVTKHVNTSPSSKQLDKEHAKLFKYVEKFYAADKAATHVAVPVLKEQIAANTSSPKHLELLSGVLDEADAVEVSRENLESMILDHKRSILSDKLAIALANREDGIDELIEEYKQLKDSQSLSQAAIADVSVLTASNASSLMKHYVESEGTFRLYPRALGAAVGNRMRPGHKITIFAPPEVGKTALVVTMSCGFLAQGKRVLYAINEDPEEDILFRHIACITGMPFDEVKDDVDKAVRLAEKGGISNLVICGMSPGDRNTIDSLVAREEPDVVIIDQLINLAYKDEGITQRLGKGARDMRTIGKHRKVLMIDVCQGADSARNKAFLDYGDIYGSNIEVPAQADLLIGIGGTQDDINQGKRILSICKNKITGNKRPIGVRLFEPISRYTSFGESSQ